MATLTYSLRFISGKFAGGEFPLRPNREITIGRGSEFDMVLDEDMVSRRHAKIATYHGQIVITDFKSTNGTFVNGERIAVANLKVGDRVLIGTSMMELVASSTGVIQPVSRVGAAIPLQVPNPNMQTELSMPARRIDPRPTRQLSGLRDLPPITDMPARGMSGRFPDDGTPSSLIEMFSNNKRSGVLVLTDMLSREGRIFFRNGDVYYATIARPGNINNNHQLPPLKCFFRMLSWSEGDFKMESLPNMPTFQDEITGSTQNWLLEGTRQLDELRRYDQYLPDQERTLQLCRPLKAQLSALSPEALDTLQLIINLGTMGTVLDYSTASDLDTCMDILYLLQNSYIVVT